MTHESVLRDTATTTEAKGDIHGLTILSRLHVEFELCQ